MRRKNSYKRISVTTEVYNRLIKDRNHFQKVIGGGKWSISDTIVEYWKMLPRNETKSKKPDKQNI